MDGLLVTPTTCLVSIRFLQVASDAAGSRLMSSSQMETPWADRSANAIAHVKSPLVQTWAESDRSVTGGGAGDVADPFEGLVCAAVTIRVRGEPELLEEHDLPLALAPKWSIDTISPESGRRSRASPERDAGLDADPGRNRAGGSTKLLVGPVLGALNHSIARHRHDPGGPCLRLRAAHGRSEPVRHLGSGGDQDHLGQCRSRPLPGRSRPCSASTTLAGSSTCRFCRDNAKSGGPVGVLEHLVPAPPRSRWHRPAGPCPGRGSLAARRSARSAGGWGRPHRRRSSRASRRRSTGSCISAAEPDRRAHVVAERPGTCRRRRGCRRAG